MIKVEVGGDAIGRVRRASKHLSAWVQTATGDLAHEGADYIRMNYLRGQALNMRTGLTYRSLGQFWVDSEKSWYIRPGIGVPKSQNYLARWIGTPREFMKPGFARFLESRDPAVRIAKAIEEKL
jgi:hypothetical protein